MKGFAIRRGSRLAWAGNAQQGELVQLGPTVQAHEALAAQRQVVELQRANDQQGVEIERLRAENERLTRSVAEHEQSARRAWERTKRVEAGSVRQREPVAYPEAGPTAFISSPYRRIAELERALAQSQDRLAAAEGRDTTIRQGS